MRTCLLTNFAPKCVSPRASFNRSAKGQQRRAEGKRQRTHQNVGEEETPFEFVPPCLRLGATTFPAYEDIDAVVVFVAGSGHARLAVPERFSAAAPLGNAVANILAFPPALSNEGSGELGGEVVDGERDGIPQ